MRELIPRSASAVAEPSEADNERRYRMLLQHEYPHARAYAVEKDRLLTHFYFSVVLPLWTPSPIALGAVGYHSRPSGSFVTLLNAFHPVESSLGKIREMQSLYHFGTVPLNSQKYEKRSVARRGIDMVQTWISRGKPETE